MDAILRATFFYFLLLIVFRLTGKRTLAQATPFDLVLILVISESIQSALIGDNFSLTNATIMVVTLVGLDIGISLLKQRLPRLERMLEDVPLVILEHGQPLRERMKKVRVGEDDILEAARELQGLESLEQIKYAVLERSGQISIIPRDR